MGNTICQSLLSKNRESLPLKWKQIYNESNIAQLLASSEIQETIKEIEENHFDQSVRASVLKDQQIRKKAYFRSSLERAIHGVRGLISPSVIRDNHHLASSGKLKMSSHSQIQSSVDDYRLQISFVIHCWASKISKDVIATEESVNENDHPVKKILDYFNDKKYSDEKESIILLSLKMARKEISKARQNDAKEDFEEYIDIFSKIMENLKSDDEVFKSSFRSSLIKDRNYKEIKGIINEFMLFLKAKNPKFEVEKEQLKKLHGAILGSINLINSLEHFLTLMDLFLKNQGVYEKVDMEETFNKIVSDFKEANKENDLYLKVLEETKKKTKIHFREEHMESWFGGSLECNNIVALKDMYIMENYDYAKVILPKTSSLTSEIHPLIDFDYRTPRFFYFFQGQLHCYDSDSQHIGEVNMQDMRTRRRGKRADRYSSIKGKDQTNCDTLELFRTKWSWSYFSYFFFSTEGPNNVICLKIYKCTNYSKEFKDDEKKDKLEEIKSERIVTFLYYRKEGSGDYLRCYFEKLLRCSNGDVFKGALNDSDQEGRYKYSIHGGYIFMRNSIHVIIISIEQCIVVAVEDIKNFSGYDSFEGKLLQYEKSDGSLVVSDIINTFEFNQPLEVLMTKIAKDENKLKIMEARRELRMRNPDEESDTDSVEISDEEMNPVEPSGEENNDKKLNLEKFEIFFYKILEMKLRVLVLSRPKEMDKMVLKKDVSEFEELFFSSNGIEQIEDVYLQIYNFLKRFRTLNSHMEASALVFVIKTLEAHLDIMVNIPKKRTSHGIICSQKLLKKFLKILSESYETIQEEYFSEVTLGGFHKARNTILKSIIELIDEEKASSAAKKIAFLKAKLKSMIQDSTQKYSYEQFFTIIKDIKMILKRDNESLYTFIGEIFALFEENALNSMIPEEIELLKNVAGKSLDLGKHRLSNPAVQHNLKMVLNVTTSLAMTLPIDDILISFISNFLDKIQNFKSLYEEIEKTFGKEEVAEVSKSDEQKMKNFDYFFSNSLTGNVISMILSFKEYSTKGPFNDNEKERPIKEADRVLRGRINEALMGVIRIVNAFNNYAIQPRETVYHPDQIEITLNKGKNEFTLINTSKSICELRLNDDTELPKGAFVAVFSPNFQTGKSQEEKRNLNLVKIWNSETSKEKIFRSDEREFLVLYTLVNDENIEGESISIKIDKTEYDLEWKSNLNIVNLAQICLGNLSQNFFKELKKIREQDQTDQSESAISNLSQVDRDKLDKVLGSDIFEYGFDKELFEENDLKSDFLNSQMSELEAARKFKDEFLSKLGMDSDDLNSLEQHCQNLQKKIERKSIYSKLGGEIGFICNLALFIVAIKHQSALPMFLDDMKNEFNMDNYEGKWLESSKIRTISRNFHTLRELVNLFRKLTFLFSLEPSNTFSLFNQPLALEKHASSFKMEESLSRKSSYDDSKQEGTDWTGVKRYLTNMRIKKQEESQESEKSLISLIIKFIQIPVELDETIQILVQRRYKFDLYNKALQFMTILFEGNQGSSALQSQIMSTFESTFRNNATLSDLTQLTINYNGLPNELIFNQISLVKNLIQKIVEFICSGDFSQESTILVALQNLKWLYKGRESDCVLAIDVQKIWKVIKKHVEDEYHTCHAKKRETLETLLESTLELIEILMGYCVRKIMQQTLSLDQTNQNEPLLGLKRHVSYIDENSITTILNKNLRILISEVEKSIANLDAYEGVGMKEYLQYLGERHFSNIGRNIASHSINFFNGSDNTKRLNEKYGYGFKFQKQETQGSTKQEIYLQKTIEETSEAGEMTSRTKTIVKPNEDKQPEFDFKSFVATMSSRKSTRKDERIVEKILIILYDNILKIPETALRLLDNNKNVNILFKIALGYYPLHLQTIAINILSELTKLTSFKIYNIYEQIFEILESRIIDNFNPDQPFGDFSDFFKGYKENLMRLCKKILVQSHQPQADKLLKLIMKEDSLTSVELLMTILRPKVETLGEKNFSEGLIVIIKSDIRNLKYIVLSRNDPIFYKRYLSRHHYLSNPMNSSNNNENNLILFDEAQQANFSATNSENKNERSMLFKAWPILCLTSGEIKIIKEEEIEIEDEDFGESKIIFETYFNNLDLLKRIEDGYDGAEPVEKYRRLKVLYKIMDLAQKYESTELFSRIDASVKRLDIENHMAVNFHVQEGFTEKLINYHFEAKDSQIAQLETKASRYQALSQRLLKGQKNSKTLKAKTSLYDFRNTFLSKSLSAKNIIDTKVALSFEDINPQDIFLCMSLLKKSILQLQKKSKFFLNKNLKFEQILNLFIHIQNLPSGYEKTKLQTKLNILVDAIEEEKSLDFVKEVLSNPSLKPTDSNLDTDQKLRDIRNTLSLIFQIADLKISSELFLQDTAYIVLDLIAKIIELYIKTDKFEDSPNSILLFICLIKRFSKVAKQLKFSHKNILDLKDESPGVSLVFDLITIRSLWEFDYTKTVGEETLYNVINNLFINIIINCEIDLTTLESKFGHEEICRRIKKLRFFESESNKDSEIALNSYILRQFFEKVNVSGWNESSKADKDEAYKQLACVSERYEIDFESERPLEITLNNKIRNWTISLKNKLFGRSQNISVYLDQELKNKVTSFTVWDDHHLDSNITTIYKYLQTEALPELEPNQKLYLTFNNKLNHFVHFLDESRYNRHYKLCSRFGKYNKGSIITDYSSPDTDSYHGHMVLKGCLFYYDSRMKQLTKYADGITKSSRRHFYREASHEILMKVSNYNNQVISHGLVYDSNDEENNKTLMRRYSLPKSKIVENLFAGGQSSCASACLVTFTDGTFAILKSEFYSSCSKDFWKLIQNLHKQTDEEFYDENCYESQIKFFDDSPYRFLYLDIMKTDRMSAQVEIKDSKAKGGKRREFWIMNSDKIIKKIDFGEEIVKRVMSRSISVNGKSYNDTFILLQNGQLYYYTRDEERNQVMDEVFTRNEKFRFKVRNVKNEESSTEDKGSNHKYAVRVHVKDAFGSFIEQISYQEGNTRIMIKFKEYGETEDVYQLRVFYDTKDRESTSTDTKKRVEFKDNAEKYAKQMRLTKESALVEPYCNENSAGIVVNDIRPEWDIVRNDRNEERLRSDLRELLLPESQRYRVKYPFFAFYNPIDDEVVAEEITEEEQKAPEVDVKAIIGRRMVKAKFKKLFDFFNNVQDNLVEEYKKFDKSGRDLEKLRGEVKDIKLENKFENVIKIGQIVTDLQQRDSTFGMVCKRPIAFIPSELKPEGSFTKEFRTIYETKERIKPSQVALQNNPDFMKEPEKLRLLLKPGIKFMEQKEIKEYFSLPSEESLGKISFNSLSSFMEDSERLGASFYFQGMIPKIENKIKNQIKFLFSLELNLLEQKETVCFYPNVYEMDQKGFTEFARMSAPLWYSKKSKVTAKIVNEATLTSLHEERKEYNKNNPEDKDIEIPALKKFLFAQNLCLSKMKKSAYANRSTRAGPIFYKTFYAVREFEKMPNNKDYDQKDFEYWFFALLCHNFKIIPFIINQPVVENEYWERDMVQLYKKNLFGCFSNQFARIYGERDASLEVSRIRGEKSTYEDQGLSLMNQFYRDFVRANDQSQKLRRVYNFYFRFVGEPGSDAGGLKREYLLLLTKEIMETLRLFIKSPNGVHNLGSERDKMVPDPKAVSVRDMDNFYKIGFCLGAVMKSGDIISLNLPSIFWKYLLGYELVWEDIKSINHSIFVCLENIEKMPESDLEYLNENFVTFLLDGSEVELKPNGRNIILTQENKLEYINLVKEKNMSQFLPAFQKMRQGFYEFNYVHAMRHFTPKEIDETLVGMNYVDLEQLKGITRYSGDGGKFKENHPQALRFWRVLESFNQKQLSGYLKYVWGRSRLSHGLNDTHKLTYYPSTSKIPEAHTCFFELDLGKYETDEDLRKKLLYGIENCHEIQDGGNYQLGADFGF